MVVLVLGGNGQLGAACCAELRRRGVDVRASVRTAGRGAALAGQGVEVVELDLTAGADARRGVLEGAECVILSANAVVPRRGDRPERVDGALAALVDDAEAAGVRRLVLPSIPVTTADDAVPFARSRRELEHRVLTSSLESWVLRFPPFMECWFALVGSCVPLRGEPNATIGRPSPFLRTFRRGTGRLVEDRGLMLVPGPASRRHAFISVADAARACAEAAVHPQGGAPEPVEVAGPEVLSWNDVAAVFGTVLGRRVRVVTTPEPVFATAARVLAPVADVPARTMALNRYLAAGESPWTTAGGGLVDPATMTRVEDFLRAKAALPDTLPVVG
jgi:uncharacterized protein YbjT (DUF2867 family)